MWGKKKGFSFKRFAKALKDVKSELSDSVLIAVASRLETDKATLANKFISPNGDSNLFRLLDLFHQQSVDEIFRSISGADIVLLLVDAKIGFDEREIALAVATCEIDKPLIAVVDGEVKERELLFKKIEKFLEIPSSDIAFVSLVESTGLSDLAVKILDKLDGKEVVAGRYVPGLSRTATDRLIKKTATQNGLIGGITILPGSDMPILTANQIRMILRISAIYGVELNFDRVRELLAVVGGGYAFRAVARQLLIFLPGIGWAIKGGVAYTGTLLLGEATKKYFESGFGYLTNEDIKELCEKITRVEK
ncbi:MAG: DUF697 domain-containing protein [Candidatus Subteraquimicrobiales bacterium]|nr:DUF697 domain-containing protein [Candidatus Subteraquimicrobiales bacterium]